MTERKEPSKQPRRTYVPCKRTITYSGKPLGDFLLKRRTELGLTLLQMEGRTGIHKSRLNRWERGIESPNHPERLTILAEALDVPAADLYLLAGLDLTGSLPSLRPYLRSKYGETLPPEALADIEAYTAQIAARYGVSTGPAPGEDEVAPH